MIDPTLRYALLVVDIQSSFAPPQSLIDRIQALADIYPTIATVERHDESKTPFLKQLGWVPGKHDNSLIQADHICVKYGYLPGPDVIEKLRAFKPDHVLVCGIQADTCVLAAGFALFDAGLHPLLLSDLVIGSSLDRSGALGVKLWRHHFGNVVLNSQDLL